MASVIREGGSQPLQVTDWKSQIKLAVLEQGYDHGLLKADLRLSSDSVRVASVAQVEEALAEMLADGWIRATEFRCTCCKALTNPKDIAKHAIEFHLTPAGYDRVPEHIFP